MEIRERVARELVKLAKSLVSFNRPGRPKGIVREGESVLVIF